MSKINITIDDELLKKVEAYCEANYQTKSGFFSQCAIEKIQAMESLNVLSEITNVLEKVVKEENIDNNTQKEIDDLVNLSNKLLMVAKK